MLRNNCIKILSKQFSTYYLQISSGYRSIYNQDNLYKEKNSNINSFINEIKLASEDKFNGYIPLEDITISYSKSSGPGGQNVNKVNTKVEIRFHLMSAKWLKEEIKVKILELEKNRINKDGYLIIKSEKTRKQLLNQADCFDKLRKIVRISETNIPEPPDEEQLRLIQQRKDIARANILRAKRLKSAIKQFRTAPSSQHL